MINNPVRLNFLLVLVMGLLAGCKGNDGTDIAASGTIPGQYAVEHYSTFLASLSTKNVHSATTAAREYQKAFGKASTELRDQGFLLFLDFYNKLTAFIQEQHRQDSTDFSPLADKELTGTERSLPPALREYRAGLEANGFSIRFSEGQSYISQNGDFLAKWFYTYVSREMREYLQQLNAEEKEGFLSDGGIIISPQAYSDRLIWWDNFISTNKNFVLLNNAKEHQKKLLTFYMTGLDNSPLLAYENGGLSEYYKTAYEYLRVTHPESEITRVVSPFYSLLLQEDTAGAARILDVYRKKGLILSDFDFRR